MSELFKALPKPVLERLRSTQTKARAIVDILSSTDHIFYQSHMRAYTTLTSHILASSPEIIGYVELHRSYRHEADLVLMRHQLQSLSGPGVTKSRYMLDKLLHNGNGVSEDIGKSPRVRSLFALRHPSETLPSILEMVARTGEKLDYSTPDGATAYYVERVARLAHEAEKAGTSFYFDAETIVDDTDRLLSRLTDFLGLNEQLSHQYQTFEQTGTAGAGDPSNNIKSGVILRDREQSKMQVPDDLLQIASTAYDQARARLISVCDMTVTTTGLGRKAS